MQPPHLILRSIIGCPFTALLCPMPHVPLWQICHVLPCPLLSSHVLPFGSSIRGRSMLETRKFVLEKGSRRPCWVEYAGWAKCAMPKGRLMCTDVLSPRGISALSCPPVAWHWCRGMVFLTCHGRGSHMTQRPCQACDGTIAPAASCSASIAVLAPVEVSSQG